MSRARTSLRLRRLDNRNNCINSLGLTTLFNPLEETEADIIFIHGLGGGSHSTWSKNGDLSLFWPQAWLPLDAAFKSVRIHTFGYKSNWINDSMLDILDFARSLLECTKSCPRIPSGENNPIILVCHSLGGLVAKSAFILSRKQDAYKDFAERLRAIIFLATPHRGSDLAETLRKILLVTLGTRRFIEELMPGSFTIKAINDEFPDYYEDLELLSFFETKKMTLGIKRAFVVPKESATLKYQKERTMYVDADHREICKFASLNDRNYLLLRDSLAGLLKDLRAARNYLKRGDTDTEQRSWLKANLYADESVEDDFLNVDSLRMPGTCSWITRKESYCNWLNASEPQIYWLTARPGTGKSVLSGFIVNNLREKGNLCSFYFLRYGDQTSLSIARFLRSIAWQMSLREPDIFDFLRKLCRNETHLDKAEYKTIWRKIFVDGIFRLTLQNPHYWVIDAIDECKNASELGSLLMKAAELGKIKIFITSRTPFTVHTHLVPSKLVVVSTVVDPDDNETDIRLFLAKKLSSIPALTAKADALGPIEELIWTKSSGSFLWVHLVLSELQQVHTVTEMKEVLDGIPSDMYELYERILGSMSRMSHGLHLAKAILSWISCAVRPLAVEELHHALQIDMKDKIDSVPRAIESTCGQLVYIDTTSRVHLVHQTAREYLLRLDDKSDFAVNWKEVHKRLAITCLNYLNNEDTVSQKRKLRINSTPHMRSAFANYASKSLSAHILSFCLRDNDLLEALLKFLGTSNVLYWIEYIANSSELYILVRAAKAFEDFTRQWTNCVATLERKLMLIRSWSLDLVRVVTRFGKNLLFYPSSIYHLIPPFCPSESAIKKQFANSARSISVDGLSATSWDDCLSTIVFQQERPTAVASFKGIFAVGLANGDINIFDESTCQSLYTLNHNENVQILKFGGSRQLLVSASRKSIYVWKLESGEIIWRFELQYSCKAFSFFDNEMLLLGLLTNSRLVLWDLETGGEREVVTWLNDMEERYSHLNGSPAAVAIMDDFSNASICPQLIAVAYRGAEVFLWDIEGEVMYDVYHQKTGSRGAQARPRKGTAPAWALTFSHVLDPPLLAAAYNNGHLVVFNTGDGSVQATTLANAHDLASSPNGLMLACGNSSSTILVFDFEKLTLLYRINAENHAIQSLMFSDDSHRLIDIRGQFCQVWDPPVLMCEDEGNEQRSDSVAISNTSQEVTFNDSGLVTYITDYVSAGDDETIFCGKSDGNVCIYKSQYGEGSRVLFCQRHKFPIRSLLYNSEKSILVSTDVSCKVMVHRLKNNGGEWNIQDAILDEFVCSPIEQVVLSADCTLLLICSAQRDSLWLLGNVAKEIATISRERQRPRRWCIHPLKPDILVLVSGNVAHLYHFHSFSRLTSERGISMLGFFSQDLEIYSIMPWFDGKVIATVYSDSPFPPFKSKILLWTTDEFAEDSASTTAVPHYQPLADDVQCLMGVCNKRLIFLHRDGWVCSADAGTFDVEKFKRHFFFPSDWLNTVRGPMVKVFPDGRIAFARGDELAIVRKGLEYSETDQPGELSSTRLSLSKRSSILTRRFASSNAA